MAWTRTAGENEDLLKGLREAFIESPLDGELTHLLGYEKRDATGRNSRLAKRLGVEIGDSEDPIGLESLKGSRSLCQNSIFNTNWSCRGASALKMRP
jgi:hypothetical protein